MTESFLRIASSATPFVRSTVRRTESLSWFSRCGASNNTKETISEITTSRFQEDTHIQYYRNYYQRVSLGIYSVGTVSTWAVEVLIILIQYDLQLSHSRNNGLSEWRRSCRHISF